MASFCNDDVFVSNNLEIDSSKIALILNYVFWKKFIGADTPYRKRKIWVPLIIGVIIFALFMTAIILVPTE